METSRWEKLKELFAIAVDLPEEERHDFLKKECGDDLDLRDEISDLLGVTNTNLSNIADAVASSLIDENANENVVANDYIGMSIGAYSITGIIGEGGMGTVFKAERIDDEYQQQVAVKLIRTQISNPKIIERFENERQILANLNHSNIAHLIDGGTSESGLPYIVMELIDGEPILEYCLKKKLNISQRLKLFKQVASAVSYAHQNLVVHRDIKPENVLVNESSEVKLLDFGIAKIVSPEGIIDLEVTQLDQRAMTPFYASPEILKGAAITTGSDVFSLGVLLFQLLTGVNPYYRIEKVPASIIKAICDTEAVKPSFAVIDNHQLTIENPSEKINERAKYQWSKKRDVETANRILSGELDSIILKSMQKDPQKRYQSVSKFLDDIDAYQNHLPISARPDSWWYRSKKFFIRNKAPVLSVTTIFILLLTATILVSNQASQILIEKERVTEERNRAIKAEIKAKREAEIASETSEFLINLFETADPRHAGNQFVTARDLLETAVNEINQGKIKDKSVKAKLLLVLGLAYQHLEEPETAEIGKKLMRESLALNITVYGEESLESAESMHRLGDAIRESSGSNPEALNFIQNALNIRQKLSPIANYEIADSYNNLSLAYYDSGFLREAEALQKKSNFLKEKLSRIGATGYVNLGLIYRRRGMYPQALEQFKLAENKVHKNNSSSRELGRVYFQIARIYADLMEYNKGLPYLKKITPLYNSAYGESHNIHILTRLLEARFLYSLGKVEDAKTNFNQIKLELDSKIEKKNFSNEAFEVYYGFFLNHINQHKKSENRLLKSYSSFVKNYGEKDPANETLKVEIALIQLKLKKFNIAEKAFKETLLTYEGKRKDPDLYLAKSEIGLAEIELSRNKQHQANLHLNNAQEILKSINMTNYYDMSRIKALQLQMKNSKIINSL